jgi:polysaccharide chain length determinant protein (PEP-CTERM system associated)
MLPGKRYQPEDVFQVAWRRKWLILVPCVLCAGLVAAVSMTLPNRYQSETLILVVPQRIPESYVRSTVTSRIEDRLRSITQQILSRTRLERIIRDLNLYDTRRSHTSLEEQIAAMRNDIKVETVKDDAFRVSYTSYDAFTAMRVTERLASLFIEENMKDREVLAEGTNEFLETQLEAARQQLVEHEKKLEAYRKQYAGQLPTQLESNLQVIQNLQIQLQALNEANNRQHDRRLVLERLIADVPSLDAPAPPEPAPTATEMALANARAGLREATGRLKPEHPDVVAFTRVVRELEAKLAAERSRASAEPTPTTPATPPSAAAQQARLREMRLEMESLDRQLAKQEADRERLQNAIGMYQARVEAAPTRESELVALTRDYDTLQQVYRSLLAKREDSKMAANLERRQVGEQFKVLDPAQFPEKPFAPDRGRMALFGAFFGLCLGIGLSTLLEYHDSKLRSDDDVTTALSLPVVAMIPAMMTALDRRRVRRRRVALALTGIGTIVLSVVAVMWSISR